MASLIEYFKFSAKAWCTQLHLQIKMAGFGHLFRNQASHYAAYRPTYPSELYEVIYSFAKLSSYDAALDIATGSGQAAVVLANKFQRVPRPSKCDCSTFICVGILCYAVFGVTHQVVDVFLAHPRLWRKTSLHSSWKKLSAFPTLSIAMQELNRQACRIPASIL